MSKSFASNATRTYTPNPHFRDTMTCGHRFAGTQTDGIRIRFEIEGTDITGYTVELSDGRSETFPQGSIGALMAGFLGYAIDRDGFRIVPGHWPTDDEA